jgi:hypothetical protein
MCFCNPVMAREQFERFLNLGDDSSTNGVWEFSFQPYCPI